MPELKPKDNYYELTEKQKAVVDVKAKHPEFKPKRLAEEASKQLDGDDSISRSYIAPILKKQEHLIQERREKLDNKREEGTQRTVGDPFNGQLGQSANENGESDSQTWQSIKDRPTKKTSTDSNGSITVELTKRDLQKLVNQDELDEFDRMMLTRVLEPQFAQ